MQPNTKIIDGLWILYWIIPGAAYIASTGNLWDALTSTSLQGQSTYMASKLIGLYALHALCLQAIVGLLGEHNKAWLGIQNRLRFHKTLGIITAALFTGHIALFILAASMRNQHFAWKLLLPNFFDGYYAAHVSIGLIAAILLGIAISAAYFIKRNAQPSRWLHRMSIIALALVFWHALSIGTETRMYGMPWVYSGLGILLLGGIGFRVWKLRT